MTQGVVFETPGLIDLRSFTVMGFNAKPNKVNPIGFFGTGLKMTVALLMRLGISMIVWIGTDKYVFYTKDEDFRGKSFQRIYMRRERQSLGDKLGVTKSHTGLSYTTELAKTWELWMGFRELESNTRDENGESYTLESVNSVEGKQGFTRIIVESDEFADIWRTRSKIFLPDTFKPILEDINVDIIEQPSQHVYYRGQRAHDVPAEKKTLFTYNVKSELELTEDRTVKSEWQMKSAIARAVVVSEDEEIIEKILTAPEKSFEKTIDFSYVGYTPSKAFMNVATRRRRHLSPSARSYAGGYGSLGMARINALERHKLPWNAQSDGIYDADGVQIFSKPMFTDFPYGVFKDLCQQTIDAINATDDVEAQKVKDDEPEDQKVEDEGPEIDDERHGPYIAEDYEPIHSLKPVDDDDEIPF